LSGVLIAAALAVLWSRHGHKVNLARFLQVTAIFLMVFVVQLLIYGFHELTEANLFPMDPKWHDMTEPFGPEGFYGQLLTYAMVLLPAVWLLVSALKDRQKKVPPVSH
jgi:high-affinity iron transporter